MAIAIMAPPELHIAPNNLGTPAVAAAFGPAGVVVVAGQHGIRYALARFGALDGGAALDGGRVRVLAAAEAADWEVVRLVALPDGRYLMCNLARRPNLYVDGATLDTAPADDLMGVPAARAFLEGERDPTPRDAFVVGGRLVLGHSSEYSNFPGYQYFSAVGPAGVEPWIHDLADRIRGRSGRSAWKWQVHRSAVLGDDVILAGMAHQRSGTSDHQFVRIGPGGAVLRIRAAARELIRDEALALVADRNRLLVAASGSLEVLDERLDPVATAPAGHPFTTAFRLLAGDGAGRLLWFSAKRHQLVLSEPADLASDALGASLDRLDAVAAATPAAKQTRRSAARKAKTAAVPRVERHQIDTAAFHDAMAGDRQELLDLFAAPPPTRLYPLPHLAENVLARASIFEREDPVLFVACRALAQGLTGQVLAHAANRRGVPSVEMPFGDATATVDSNLRLGDASAPRWRDAWYAALVARDERCLDLLDGLADTELDRGLAHGLAWKAALQAYRVRPGSVGPAVERAVEASARNHFRTSFQWRAHLPHTSVYPALAPLAAGDPVGFNAALLEALRAHRKYFGTKSESRTPRGWIALGPLALCCLAHDRGMVVEVDSEYLLPYLVERRFPTDSRTGGRAGGRTGG
jgi:hypothetical protein